MLKIIHKKTLVLVCLLFVPSLLANINSDLRKSIIKGNFQQVKYLHKQGGDIFQKDAQGVGLLHLAVLSGNVNIVEYLLQNGLDPNQKDFTLGTSPIHLAAHTGNLKILELLLSIGGDINLQETKSGYSSLHIAAKRGFIDILDFLLEKNANTEILDSNQKIFIELMPSSIKKFYMNKLGSFTLKSHCKEEILELNEIRIGEIEYSYETQSFLFEKFYYKNSKNPQLETCIFEFLEQNPEKRYWTAIFLFDKNYSTILNFEMARKILELALKDPKKLENPSSYYFLLGLLNYRIKNFKEAKKLIQKAYKLSEKYPGGIPALTLEEKQEIDRFMQNKFE